MYWHYFVLPKAQQHQKYSVVSLVSKRDLRLRAKVPAGGQISVAHWSKLLVLPPLLGEVFHSTVPEKLSLATASTHCHSLGAQLATVGQLYLAWQAGLDQCDPGWLADGSVRYPINVPRKNCGGDEPGVRTVYNNPNRTGFPDTTALYDAYCYRGTGSW